MALAQDATPSATGTPASTQTPAATAIAQTPTPTASAQIPTPTSTATQTATPTVSSTPFSTPATPTPFPSPVQTVVAPGATPGATPTATATPGALGGLDLTRKRGRKGTKRRNGRAGSGRITDRGCLHGKSRKRTRKVKGSLLNSTSTTTSECAKSPSNPLTADTPRAVERPDGVPTTANPNYAVATP